MKPILDPETQKHHDIIDERLEDIKHEINDIKAKISTLRKAGMNTKVPEVRLLNLIPKMRMAQATHSENDVQAVKEILDNIEKDLKETITENHFTESLQLIERIGVALNNNEPKSSLELYKTLQENYRELPEDLRKMLFPASIQIRENILKMHKQLSSFQDSN